MEVRSADATCSESVNSSTLTARLLSVSLQWFFAVSKDTAVLDILDP